MLSLLGLISIFVSANTEAHWFWRVLYVLFLLLSALELYSVCDQKNEYYPTEFWAVPFALVCVGVFRLILLLFWPPFANWPPILNSANVAWCLVMLGFVLFSCVEIPAIQRSASSVNSASGYLGERVTITPKHSNGFGALLGALVALVAAIIFLFFHLTIGVRIAGLVCLVLVEIGLFSN